MFVENKGKTLECIMFDGEFHLVRVGVNYLGGSELFLQCRFHYLNKKVILLQLDSILLEGKFLRDKTNIHYPYCSNVNVPDMLLDFLIEHRMEVVKRLFDEIFVPVLYHFDVHQELQPYRMYFLLGGGLD
jgi:hypothetical protein